MKKIKGATAVLMALILFSIPLQSSLAANGNYGAAAVEEGRTYDLNQMLTYAIQDEYLAKARYTTYIEKFGQQLPFTRIVEAEYVHIALISALFEKYGFTLPEDKSDAYIIEPVSILAATEAGIEGEINNIRMYETFLSQELPDDVKNVFTILKNASGNHLRAFERVQRRLEGSCRSGYKQDLSACDTSLDMYSTLTSLKSTSAYNDI